MNDFTKEELQEIVDMVNDIHNGSQGHGLSLHFDLRDKIQSMIDNYCDHSLSNSNHDYEVEQCCKCGKLFV